MSFRQDNKSSRDRMKRWESFCEANRALIDQIGLPTPTIDTEERFTDLLMHGHIDHHDDWSRFVVDKLSLEKYTTFKVLVDRYFAAGYEDPGLMAVGHGERVRLAGKYPSQFANELVELANRPKDDEQV